MPSHPFVAIRKQKSDVNRITHTDRALVLLSACSERHFHIQFTFCCPQKTKPTTGRARHWKQDAEMAAVFLIQKNITSLKQLKGTADVVSFIWFCVWLMFLQLIRMEL